MKIQRSHSLPERNHRHHGNACKLLQTLMGLKLDMGGKSLAMSKITGSQKEETGFSNDIGLGFNLFALPQFFKNWAVKRR